MLMNQFDTKKNLRYARYGRMSNPTQNPRSPDQQFDTIEEVKQRCNFQHWINVAEYRDDGISGRYIRKRLGFQKLMLDIKTGKIKIDAILVDTIERFGRMESLSEIRRELYNKYGILVLTADTLFADPTSPQGQVCGAVENMRATEDGRIKAHNVSRGKKDAVKLKRWPGGPIPFGFKLEHRTDENNGKLVSFNVLVPDPQTAWIVRLVFQKALETGYGQSRLARFLNENEQIPDQFKDFEPHTVGTWIENELYHGVMVYPKVATDVVDDSRVIQAVPVDHQIRIDDYCERIVSDNVFHEVNTIRKLRGNALKEKLNKSDNEEAIRAPAPGMTLNYILTGLVRCGHCDRAMVPNGTTAYTTQDGKENRYTAYMCPGSHVGNCHNRKRIPEEWLRKLVIQRIRDVLFPGL